MNFDLKNRVELRLESWSWVEVETGMRWDTTEKCIKYWLWHGMALNRFGWEKSDLARLHKYFTSLSYFPIATWKISIVKLGDRDREGEDEWLGWNQNHRISYITLRHCRHTASHDSYVCLILRLSVVPVNVPVDVVLLLNKTVVDLDPTRWIN